MDNNKAIKIFYLIFFFVVAVVAVIYGLLFDSMSETNMIQLSYLWSGPMLFSILGLIAAYSGSRKPFLVGLIGMFSAPVLLFLFFQVFWQML